ncbi:hypothetical protein KAI54_01500, partial [Candidatus Gracilibacteria bacterium]|nr:hypothetical protein [Candidatus Gracilibacteria bacterium]
MNRLAEWIIFTPPSERRGLIKSLLGEDAKFEKSKEFVKSVVKKLEMVSSLDDKPLLKVAKGIFGDFRENAGSISVPEQDFQRIGIFLEILNKKDLTKDDLSWVTNELKIY